MKSLKDIKALFAEEVSAEPVAYVREYLQYEILKILFRSKYGPKFTFLGGTCLRICYQIPRFSEDLDFDNVELSKKEFEDAAAIIQKGLEALGYTVTIRFAYKGAFHCHIKFPALLYHYELSGHKEAKLLIKLDTEKQHYEYKREIVSLNKFGVQTDIRAVPLSLLGSQKIAAIMGRKRAKGRDYFDLRFILAKTGLDYGYLEERFGVTTPEELRKLVADHIATLDFDQLAADVSPFLFEQQEVDNVRNFPAYWQSVNL